MSYFFIFMLVVFFVIESCYYAQLCSVKFLMMLFLVDVNKPIIYSDIVCQCYVKKNRVS